jgi:UDP-2-acetamido-3-amino-2,3-dideoxy-glucuronate N-acetyltransferase
MATEPGELESAIRKEQGGRGRSGGSVAESIQLSAHGSDGCRMSGDSTFIHPTAEIAAGASIGPGCRIWQHCIVLTGAQIGARVKFGRNVMVESGVTVGNGCTIKDNVSLYAGVTLEDDVFVGPTAVFTNVINPRAFIGRKSEFKQTRIRQGATVGANATLLCGITIGRYAMIGAGAVVTHDVPDHALIVGNPGRRVGWVSRNGHRLDAKLVCPETGERYAQAASGLAPA